MLHVTWRLYCILSNSQPREYLQCLHCSHMSQLPTQGQSYKRAITQLITSKKEPAALLLERFRLGRCPDGSCMWMPLLPVKPTDSRWQTYPSGKTGACRRDAFYRKNWKVTEDQLFMSNSLKKENSSLLEMGGKILLSSVEVGSQKCYRPPEKPHTKQLQEIRLQILCCSRSFLFFFERISLTRALRK